MLDATPRQPLPGFRTYTRMLSLLTRRSDGHLSAEFAEALLEQYSAAHMIVEYVDVLCVLARQSRPAPAAFDLLSPASLLAAADFGWTIVQEHASSVDVIVFVRFESGRVEETHCNVARDDWYVYSTQRGLELCEDDERELTSDMRSWFESRRAKHRDVFPVSSAATEAA